MRRVVGRETRQQMQVGQAHVASGRGRLWGILPKSNRRARPAPLGTQHSVHPACSTHPAHSSCPALLVQAPQQHAHRWAPAARERCQDCQEDAQLPGTEKARHRGQSFYLAPQERRSVCARSCTPPPRLPPFGAAAPPWSHLPLPPFSGWILSSSLVISRFLGGRDKGWSTPSPRQSTTLEGGSVPWELSLQEGSFPCQRQGFLELWSVRLTLWVKTTILKTIGMHCTWKK